jgi:hypothetical protein
MSIRHMKYAILATPFSAKTIFRRGKRSSNPPKNEYGKRTLDLMVQCSGLQHDVVAEEIYAHALAAGQDVQRQRHVEVLRGGPEPIAVGRTVGPIIGSFGPDHSAFHPFLNVDQACAQAE